MENNDKVSLKEIREKIFECTQKEMSNNMKISLASYIAKELGRNPLSARDLVSLSNMTGISALDIKIGGEFYNDGM